MIATIVGSTGLTGTFLVRHLLADPDITKVVSISRRSTALSDAKLVEVLLSDLGELPSLEAKVRGELYFCCLGTTIKAAGSQAAFEKVDHDAVLAFAKLARAHDARSLTIVSAMGADARSFIFYNRVKGRTEADVTSLGLRSLNLFRPALLAGPRTDHRAGEKLASKTLVPLAHLLPGNAGKSLVTEVDTLAARMLAQGKAAPTGTHIIRAKNI